MEKDVFNPAAVVKDGRIAMILRAEDTVGRYAGTSRIGLAWSTDGLRFEVEPNPVLYPDHDEMEVYEWEGGCEDPRVVEAPDGRFVMTYTAYDGKTARLCVATSSDLREWQKQGLALPDQPDTWSKSGAIVSRLHEGRLVAAEIGGWYWMYWGESDVFVARSRDLVKWETLGTVFSIRAGMPDSDLVEPGPTPVVTDAGIVFIYNSKNLDDPSLPKGTYTAFQALLDAENPGRLLDRTETPFFRPERPYEITGQIANVVFLEGLVPFRDRWWLYYGTADSKIAVASAGILRSA